MSADVTRPAASIVVVTWNAWEWTRACLESLRPTLGVRDQVIVVDNGSTDATVRRLAGYPWLRVIANPENRGVAAGRNQGGAVAAGEAVVFLDPDTVLPRRWLDALLAPFADPEVAAAGAVSNYASGAQLLSPVPYTSVRAMHPFARGWEQAHRGQVQPAERLDGFCLAVRGSALRGCQGFDERYGSGALAADDLCRELLCRGGRLVVSRACFVHHAGQASIRANGVDFAGLRAAGERVYSAKWGVAARTEPRVSACLIVRDEEENLPACLSSVAGLVDEVVVYDTGSVDGTRELARQLGALVVEGYWDDDFARARNAALAHCTGDWILWLDADETLTTDPARLRSTLAGTSEGLDGFLVPISNAVGTGLSAEVVHSAVRLFRRAGCRWQGALHEQILRWDGAAPQLARLDHARIEHRGYLDAVMAQRGKAARNLKVAQAAADRADTDGDPGQRLVDLGRAQFTAGQFAQAVLSCRSGAQRTGLAPSRRLGYRVAAEAALRLGRPQQALECLADLSAAGGHPALVASLSGRAQLLAGRPEEALATLSGVREACVDEDGFGYGPHTVAADRVAALAALGRAREALLVCLQVLSAEAAMDVPLVQVVELVRASGSSFAELARAVPATRLPHVLGQALLLPVDTADELMEAVAAAHPDQLAVLAGASRLAVRLGVQRALVWATRLRARGLGSACPLLAIGADPGRSLADRALALASAHAHFRDARAERLLDQLAAGCPDSERARVSELLAPASAAAARLFAPAQPRVSLVLPVGNQAERTARCLQALAAHLPGELAFEVVVVDNASTDATAGLLAGVSGDIQVLRNETDQGFAAACAQGAQASVGEYLGFLSPDIAVQPGWLQALVAALDADPRRGAACPTAHGDGQAGAVPSPVLGALLRRSAYEATGGLAAAGPDPLGMLGGQPDLFAALAAAGYLVHHEPASQVRRGWPGTGPLGAGAPAGWSGQGAPALK